ncbi:MAG: glutathione S-transferase family protein [Myxococcota bacterium]
MSIEVWWGSGSTPAWRVLLGFTAKNVPFTSNLLSFSAGDTRKPAFLAINPRGKVPAIRDGAYRLNESLAILAWLDRKHPEVPLFGTTAEDHGTIWRLCLEYENHGRTAFDAVARPLAFGRAEAEADAIRAGVAGVHEELARLEAAVGGGYLVGGALSAADLVWFCGVQWAIRGATRPAAAPFELGWWPLVDRYPAIAAWAARIEAIPGYDATMPPHWLEGAAPSPRRIGG